MGLLRTFSQIFDAPFAGRVIMVSKEEHVPYDRPILSKVSVEFCILQREKKKERKKRKKRKMNTVYTCTSFT